MNFSRAKGRANARPSAFFINPTPHPAMRLLSGLRAVLILASLVVLSGCASFKHIANYPTPAQPVTVSVVSKPMSKMNELPVGAYYDPTRQIIISGHQKGLGWGMLFGVVGVLVADSANKSSAENRFGASANSSTTDLVVLTKEVLNEELTKGRAPRWSAAPGAGQLQLSPYALFTVLPSGKARLHALLKAEIPGKDGDPAWSVRYYVPAPGEYTIEGDGGWMKQDRFVTALRTAVQRGVELCMDDANGKFTAVQRKAKAKGLYPFMNIENFELPILVVEEGPDTVVARLAVGDVAVMSGTHVLNKADYTFTDADFKDPRP
jgi:hypothetical protein